MKELMVQRSFMCDWSGSECFAYQLFSPDDLRTEENVDGEGLWGDGQGSRSVW